MSFLNKILNKNKKTEINTTTQAVIKPHYLTGQYIYQLIAEDRLNSALDLLDQYEQTFDIENLLDFGEAFFYQQLFDHAIHYFDKASKLNDPIAYEWLGIIYHHLYQYKNLAQVNEHYLKSVLLGNSHAYIGLADLFIEEDGYVNLEKSKHFTDLALSNNHNEAYYYQGKYYAEIGQFELAHKSFQTLEDFDLHTSSVYGLSLLYYHYTHSPFYDPEKAFERLNAIIDEGSEPERFSFLADFYTANTPYQNEAQAIQLYSIGMQQGCLYSEAKLYKLRKQKK